MLRSFRNTLPVRIVTDAASPGDGGGQYFRLTWTSQTEPVQQLTFLPPLAAVPAESPTGAADSLRNISFKSPFLEALPCWKTLRQPITLPVTPASRLLLQFISELRRAPPATGTLANIQLASAVQALIAEVLRQVETCAVPAPAGRRKAVDFERGKPIIYAVRYMKQHMNDPQLSLGAIAQSVGYHPNYFCQKFSFVFSRSPIQYLNEMRLRRTLALLEETDYSIKKIGVLVGIRDPGRLRSLVKTYAGMAPVAFRRLRKPPSHGTSHGIKGGNDDCLVR